MMDFIERLRAKPDHTRKQIAFAASVGATALVTLVWFTAFSASGALSQNPTVTKNDGIGATFSKENGASLLGAIGALTTKQDGSIQVVGTHSSSTVQTDVQDERTVIPF